MAHVLIATLGDSPIVVTSMFDLLTQQEKLPIEKVLVIHPKGENREFGYMVIHEALKELCDVDAPLELPFEDTYTEETCFIFLQELFTSLLAHQEQGDTVYLSLAGGRKNMSALMALAAPFYPCVKGLYHVIDNSEHTSRANFKTVAELVKLYNTGDTTRLTSVMHPDINGLQLVPIPLDNTLRVSEIYIQKLLKMTPEQMLNLWEDNPDEADRVQFDLQLVALPSNDRLKIKLTERAKAEYERLVSHDVNLTQKFEHCMRSMQSAQSLKDTHCKETLTNNKKRSFPSYVYRKGHTTERPFFHTEPGDIMNHPQNTVNTVVVERFAKHRTKDEYIPSAEELLSTPYHQGEPLHDLDAMLRKGKSIPSVLVVPMGAQPMIATQLYTLLKERERRDIQKVVLLYPERAAHVRRSTQQAAEAFRREGILCELSTIKGLTDVASRADCERYQEALKQIIEQLQKNFLPQLLGGRLDLALSGGRKGMAALALFVAQRTQLHAVYHTLIADKALNDKIEYQTEPERFERLKPKEQNNILFLRDYEGRETDFSLFRVPIGPLHGE